MADDRLGPLSETELRTLLDQVDSAIAEGQDLRRRIVDAMRERLENPKWPDVERRRKPRNGR